MAGGARAFVLAAGLGTRLRPLTETWPKPAVPFLGAPLLRRTLAVLARGGVDRVALNTHHLPEVMERIAREEGARRGLAVRTVHEPVIQGTGGGLRGLQRALPGIDVVVAWNGDILFAPDLGPLLAEHRASGAAATMLLLPMPRGRSYGVVEIDGGGRVRRIGRPGPSSLPGCTAWHFSGVHLLSPRVFEVMTPDGPEDINHDVYPRLFGEDGVRGTVLAAPWSDLGSAATYLEAQADLLLGRVPDPLGAESPLAGRPRGGALVEPGARVHPGADLSSDVFVAAGVEVPSGARVRGTALLAGAALAAGEAVSDEIRWDGKRLRARSAPELMQATAEALNFLGFVASRSESGENPSAELHRELLRAVRSLQDFIAWQDPSASDAGRLIGAAGPLLEHLSEAVETREPSLSEIRARATAFLLAAGFPPPS
jgi:mannose-1-phosphate guanylyltransferase